jgi:para-nitrobenzyl esterase
VTAEPRVSTVSGDVSGAAVTAPSGRGVQRFLGIPYAAPPVGHLRWRPPVTPGPWSGVRAATAFAPAAPQRGALESRLPGFSPNVPTSEDCLALNVWTPRLDGARPVLVWLPGGAYLSGATA